MDKVPVIVLSGFLGSGKTTLLLRLLNEARLRGLKAMVLMNELGHSDVDGTILQGAFPGIGVEKLMDGCMCCTKKSEVAGCISRLLIQQPDLILIELTGVANPDEVSDCLTEPFLLGKVALKQIITVLDSEHVPEYNSIFSTDKELVHTLRKQMELADLLILNKIDRLKLPYLAKIEKAVRKYNPYSPIVYSIECDIDVQSILADISSRERRISSVRNTFKIIVHKPAPSGHKHQHPHQASYSRVRSMVLSFQEGTSIKTKKLEDFLDRWSSQLLRAKGYVSVNGEGSCLLQYALKRAVWQKSNYKGPSYLVLIGLNLDWDKLFAEWESLFGHPAALI